MAGSLSRVDWEDHLGHSVRFRRQTTTRSEWEDGTLTNVDRDEQSPTEGVEITLSTGDRVIIPLEIALSLIEITGHFEY